MTERLTATLTSTHEGMRVDRALAELFPAYSRSFLSRLVENGHVLIDTSQVTRTSHRVAAGQTIEVEIPPPRSTAIEPQQLPIHILHEDDDIVVIDKPAGLVVHPSAGHEDATLVNALLFHVTQLSGIGGELRPGIVHRLDKDTSGVMVIAKNDHAHRTLQKHWNSERVTKEYLALVYGTPSRDSGVIDAPIGRDPRERKRMAVVPGGRRAVTEYSVVEPMRYVSLVRCSLRTGRTHQIRVHMKHLGHPIVGDPLYSGPQWRGIPSKPVQKTLAAFRRQALHAWRITVEHPSSGQPMTFESPLAGDMKALVAALR